jgi:O-antigen ligase
MLRFGLSFLSFPVLYLIIAFPKLWLYSVVILFTVFFSVTDEELNILEVLTALIYNGGLLLWFVWYGLVLKKKIIRNSADWLILFFFAILLLGNSIIAVLNGVNIGDWIREYILFMLTLYYFPFREYFNDKQSIINLLVLIAAVIFIVDFKQFYIYYAGLTSGDIKYAYEIGRSVRINQTIFTISSIFGFIFTFNQKKIKYEYLILIFTSVTIAALVTTFSRTFWVILIFALIVMFLFQPIKKKIKMIIYVGLISTVLIGAVYIVAKDNLKIVFTYVEKRLKSSTKGKKDISLQSRLSEWRSVHQQMEYKWLAGNGLAKKFSFYNPITEITKHTSIIHNGYIYFAYRTGIPLTLIYFFFFSYYFYKSFILLRLVKDPFFKVMIVATFGSILSMYIINLTSSQFVYRDGLFTVAFLVAFTSIVEENYLKGKA